MTKTIQELTDNLQNIAHSGDAQKNIYVKRLDAYYKISGVKKVVSGDETYYVIETEV